MTMKYAVKMRGSNFDWGEQGELPNRFNTPLYYIFASFCSRSTNFWPTIVVSLFLDYAKIFDHWMILHLVYSVNNVFPG